MYRSGNANERYLWYGSDQGSNYDAILQKGFVSGINTTPVNRQVMYVYVCMYAYINMGMYVCMCPASTQPR